MGRINIKQKIFLIISALIVLHGTILLIMYYGRIALLSYTVHSNFLFVIGFITMALFYKYKIFRSYISFAVLVCILITGIVYNIMLVPFTDAPIVFLGYGNFVTHLLSMVLAVINYLIFEEKKQFTFKHILAPGIPSFMYWLFFILFGGAIDWHPYFFMDPRQITWGMIFFWLAIIIVFFMGLSLAIVFFDNKRKKHALYTMISSLVLCAVLIFAAGDRVQERLHTTFYDTGLKIITNDFSGLKTHTAILEPLYMVRFDIAIRRGNININIIDESGAVIDWIDARSGGFERIFWDAGIRDGGEHTIEISGDSFRGRINASWE